ncbi:MAG: hypothetical protein CSA63_00355 [Propionibacterium sp.]|nr:MAG: hypothetical protein CSA63_00355 [Propionibacterium sp.]
MNRTYRPRLSAITGVVLSVVLVVVTVWFWIAVGPEIRALATVGQIATLVLIFGALIFGMLMLGGSRVTVTKDGIRYRNWVRTFELGWGEIAGFRFRPSDPWAYVILPGPEEPRKALLAIQSADGAYGRSQYEALVAAWRENS